MSDYRRNIRLARRFKRRETHVKGKTNGEDDDQLRKIGSSLEDATVIESYDHKLIRPFYKDKVVLPKKWVAKKPRSLKLLASITLARNCLSITSSHLKIGQWQLWSDVWELIIANEMDSPYLFEIFAERFHESDLQLHCFIKGQHGSKFSTSSNHKRNEIVLLQTLRNRNHRLETLSLNVRNFPECLNHKHFSNLVILDLSSLKGCSTIRPSYIKLTNIRSLGFLNCNGLADVDESILKTWMICLKIGKWPLLKLLCVKDTSISSDGLKQLMCLPNLQLYYIETSHKTGSEYWKIVKSPSFTQKNTSLKYYYTEKHFKPSFIKDLELNRRFIMDYKMTDTEFKLENNFEKLNHFLERLWSQRFDSYNDNGSFEYLLQNEIKDTVLDAPPKVKRHKIIKATNHKQFFDL